MGLIKLAFIGSANRNALYQAAGEMKGGFLNAKAKAAQDMLNTQFNSVDKIHELRGQLARMSEAQKVVHGARIRSEINDHLAAGKQARSAFQSHVGFDPSQTNAARKAAAVHAETVAANKVKGITGGKTTDVVDKIKNFASANKGKLAIGAGVVGAGLIANHLINKQKQNQQVGYFQQ